MSMLVSRMLLSAIVLLTLVVTYYAALGGPFLLDDITSVLPATMDHPSLSELWRVARGDTSGLELFLTH